MSERTIVDRRPAPEEARSTWSSAMAGVECECPELCPIDHEND